jgi:hypothetical protein
MKPVLVVKVSAHLYIWTKYFEKEQMKITDGIGSGSAQDM